VFENYISSIEEDGLHGNCPQRASGASFSRPRKDMLPMIQVREMYLRLAVMTTTLRSYRERHEIPMIQFTRKHIIHRGMKSGKAIMLHPCLRLFYAYFPPLFLSLILQYAEYTHLSFRPMISLGNFCTIHDHYNTLSLHLQVSSLSLSQFHLVTVVSSKLGRWL